MIASADVLQKLDWDRFFEHIEAGCPEADALIALGTNRRDLRCFIDHIRGLPKTCADINFAYISYAGLDDLPERLKQSRAIARCDRRVMLRRAAADGSKEAAEELMTLLLEELDE